MATLLPRSTDARRLLDALTESPVVVLTGPRQAGKSTLARTVVGDDPSHRFDLEDPADLARLSEPIPALRALAGTGRTVVIDEAQRLPSLFPELRVLVDEDRRPGRFLVLGSASPALIGLSADSLAGRVRLVELGGLRVEDVGAADLDRLWERGGLPLSFLGADDGSSCRWRDDYIATFLERDLASLGVRVPATTMRRFWTMVAHFHAQTWNGAELARGLGVSLPTIRRYVDALTDALVLRQVPPWFENLAKRQVRSPKVYVRDTGLLHRLLGIADRRSLDGHPKVGASWEGFVIEHLVTGLDGVDASFWGTHGGAEIDLRVEVGGRRLGIEVKRTTRPSATRSARVALDDLGLDAVLVVHAGEHRFPLGDRIEAVPAIDLLADPGGVLGR